MGKSQRTKGATYEREVASALSMALGIDVKRHIGQARDGGEDMIAGCLDVECKRRKTLTVVEAWLSQAERARTRHTPDGEAHYPTVIARQDNGRSLVVMRLRDFLDVAGPELRRRIEVAR